MAPPVKTPRAAWIEAGLRALGEGGPEAVRVDVLARTLGVTRGGFYGHFADRAALLQAVLDGWERRSTDEVLTQADAASEDPRVRIRSAGRLTFSEDLRPIDLAVRGWARHDPAVAQRLRRVDDARMDYLREMFSAFCDDEAEVEARSLLAFSAAIGHHFVAAGHGERTRPEALELAIEWLLR